jgi:hypothetical protein
MKSQELKNVLEMHKKWVMGQEGGSKADLSSADLSYANLCNVNLSYTDLSNADLNNADLSFANLSFADLNSADLRSANLNTADLRNADLRNADLLNANLSYTDLRNANLGSADLRNADLLNANLRNANLRNTNLHTANLSFIKDDFYRVIEIVPMEILGLYDALMRGQVDGTQYSGECACLVGTIANQRKEHYEALTVNLKPDASRPAERWFLAIAKGDTPQNNQISKITCEWIEEFCKSKQIPLPSYKLVSSVEYPEVFK